MLTRGLPASHVVRGVAGALTAVLLVSGCAFLTGADEEPAGPQLRFPGLSDPAGYSRDNTPLNEPVAVSTFNLCTVGGDVDITGIRLRDASSMEVVDWGLRPYEPLKLEVQGAWLGRVLDDPTYRRNPVHARCDTSPSIELKIGVKRTADPGITHGFDIDYEGGSLFVPFRIILCSKVCSRDLFTSDLP